MRWNTLFFKADYTLFLWLFEEIFYYSGIHEFDNITDLLLDLKETFIKNSVLREIIPKDYNSDNFYIYKYEKPKSHINGYEMRKQIDNSTLVFKKQKIFPIWEYFFIF